MKVYTPEISWHERDPIYTCHFHPVDKNKLATSGVSGVIRLWEIKEKLDSTKPNEFTSGIGSPKDCHVGFIANLKRHVKSVNVVRWNSAGDILASAGDEACVFLWKENEIKNQSTLDMDEDDNKENWFSFKTFRGHLEDILDLSWSKDGSIIISGSIDNSVIVWDVATGNKLSILKEPKGFVQGVVCDPLGETYACLATDRSLRIFSAKNYRCIFSISKIQMSKENVEPLPNCVRIFHDDTMKSFYRRMCFTPDGNLLFAPSGCIEIENKTIDASYIFTRNSYTKPSLYIPHDKPSVAVSCCPLKYELNAKKSDSPDKIDNLFSIPYRYIFAIATEDSVCIYDTQNLLPFSYVTGIHYSTISDLSWSSDGRMLCITSIDGFCSLIMFAENQLGIVYSEPAVSLEEVPMELVNENENTIKVDPVSKEQKQNQLNFTSKKVILAKSGSNVSTDGCVLIEEDSMAKVAEKVDEVKTLNIQKPVIQTLDLQKNDGGKKRIKLVPL